MHVPLVELGDYDFLYAYTYPINSHIILIYPLRFPIYFWGGYTLYKTDFKISFYMGILRGSPGRLIIWKGKNALIYYIELSYA